VRPPFDKQEISSVLEEMADLMELAGENPFRARSFRAAARSLEATTEDIGSLVASGRLKEIPGIGPALESIISELCREGRSPRHEELKNTVPVGLLDLLRVGGLGPKKARQLYQNLGIAGLPALEAACRSGKVAEQSGFGEKMQAKILAGIEYLRQVGGRFLQDEALAAGRELLDRLRGDPNVIRADLAGSIRRRRETVKDIDLVAASADPESVMKGFISAAESSQVRPQVVAHGPTKSSIRLASGMQADLRVVSDAEFPFALLHFTGSMEHNTAMRGRARNRGFKLNEYGLHRLDAGDGESEGEKLACRSEAEIFSALGLAFIEPELREDRGEIDLAEAGRLPRLVEAGDIRGVVHAHTTYSDGRHSLEQMAEAARAAGYGYLAVTDHSQSAGYAGGLREDRIREQHREIEALNARLQGLRIFKGIESDIRTDGSLDYPPEVLDLFDFVIASVHSNFGLTETEQTERVLRALRDPHCTILGHPTGRLLLERSGFAIRMEEVIRAAASLGAAIEINAHPRRLDLDWRWGSLAREAGLKTCISPDAHSTEGIRLIEFGVGIARKAGFSASEVVNTYPADGFAAWIRTRRR